MCLAIGRVAARDQHRRPRGGRPVGHVDEGGDEHARQALEDHLLDPEAVHLDAPGDARVERRALARQASDHREHLVAQIALQQADLGLRAKRGEASPPRVVLPPGQPGLIAEQRRDARPFRRRRQDGEGVGRRCRSRLGGQQAQDDEERQSQHGAMILVNGAQAVTLVNGQGHDGLSTAARTIDALSTVRSG